jgi:hypothetical protein
MFFWDRFKSIPTQDLMYVQNLARYIQIPDKKNIISFKLFSYWISKKIGFPATVIGRVLQRSNTAVLRSALLGRTIAQDKKFPILLLLQTI